MEYKILEQIGVDNENVDGAAFNNFVASGQDGIIREVLNECAVYAPTSNAIAINTGEMLVHGFRVKITEPWSHTFTATPSNPVAYQLVGRITLNSDRAVTFDILCREKQALEKTPLFVGEEGVYEAEIARFTHTTAGTVSEIVRTMELIDPQNLFKGFKTQFENAVADIENDIKELQSSHMVNVTQLSTIYDNESELPIPPSQGNGARYVVRTNGALPLFIYSYDADSMTWTKNYQVKGSTLYLNLEDGCMYRYTNSTNTKPYPNFIQMTVGVGAYKDLVEDIDDFKVYTDRNVKNLYAITAQNGLYTMLTTEQAYASRVTADGENIVDGASAEVLKIAGSTVVVDGELEEIEVASLPVIIMGGITALRNEDGGYTINGKADEDISVKISEDLALSFGTGTLSGASRGVILHLYKDGEIFASAQDGVPTSFSTDGSTAVYTLRIYIPDGMSFDDTVIYPRITFRKKNVALKHAYFKGIKSTNADGTESSTLTFPKTPTPLGTTIDFENKKITDYGVDLVLTGTEAIDLVTSYSKEFGYGVNIINVLLPGTSNAVGVCTDAVVGTLNTSQAVIQLGHTAGGNVFPNIYWAGILHTLGIYTGAEQPTGETLTTAEAKFKAYLAQRYADGNPVTIRYVSSTLQSETDFTEEQLTAGNNYAVWNVGTETIMQGDTDNSADGVMLTVTQEYFKLTGGTSDE